MSFIIGPVSGALVAGGVWYLIVLAWLGFSDNNFRSTMLFPI
jgi:hypothetical protein